MKHFSCLRVVLALSALAAAGCGLVLDTQPRENSSRDLGMGGQDLGDGSCQLASDCDDGNVCNGREDCVDGQCVGADANLDCNDGVECTDDSCDRVFGCVNAPNDAVCGTAGFCFPDVGCAPSRACDTPLDCGLRDACLGAFDCVENNCVLQQALTCPEMGCLAGVCRRSACIYAPDSSRCGGEGCARGTCGSDGRCSAIQADDTLCDDGATCTIDTCLLEGERGFCSYEVDLSVCDDGVTCTVHACDPADPNAADVTGCLIGYIDAACTDANSDRCSVAVCLPTGCEAGVVAHQCPEGGVCNVRTGACEVSEGCPNGCADFGSPCVPAVCVDNQCVSAASDPCVSTTACTLGYCDISGDTPTCALRPDPACFLTIQVPVATP